MKKIALFATISVALSACTVPEILQWADATGTPLTAEHVAAIHENTTYQAHTTSELRPTDAQLFTLRLCESTNNYRAVNRSGKYRGAYQFDRQTWNSISDADLPGSQGVDPAAAAPAMQDRAARLLFQARGWAPWPECGRKARAA